MEVLVNPCCSRVRGILLLAWDRAPEREGSFYAKIKVRVFFNFSIQVNFEVDRLKKKKNKMMMKKSVF